MGHSRGSVHCGAEQVMVPLPRRLSGSCQHPVLRDQGSRLRGWSSADPHVPFLCPPHLCAAVTLLAGPATPATGFGGKRYRTSLRHSCHPRASPRAPYYGGQDGAWQQQHSPHLSLDSVVFLARKVVSSPLPWPGSGTSSPRLAPSQLCTGSVLQHVPVPAAPSSC